MSRLTYVRFLRRYWWLLVSVPLVAAALAYLVSQRIEPQYEATATVVILNRPATTAANPTVPVPALTPAAPAPGANAGLTDLLVDPRLIATYLELVERRPVLEEVVSELGFAGSVEDLAAKVSASNPQDTQLIRIRAVDPIASDAATIANSIARNFIDSSEGEIGNSGTLALVEPASPASEPFTPNVMLNVGMVFILAGIGAASLAMVLERFNRSLKTTDDVEDLVGLPALGLVPRTSSRTRNNAWLANGRSDWAASFRNLRGSLIADGFGHNYRSILVTSATPGVGKTTVAANLAISFALAGFKVLIVDLNLRTPRLHELFGVTNSAGIAQYLSGREPLTVLESAFPNLRIIPAGVLDQHPDDILAGGLSDEFMRAALSQADVVIVDSPALSVSPDAVVLANNLATSLLVAQAGKTSADELKKAGERLAASHALPAGVVLNRVGRTDDRISAGRRTGNEAVRRAPDLTPAEKSPGTQSARGRSRRASGPSALGGDAAATDASS